MLCRWRSSWRTSSKIHPRLADTRCLSVVALPPSDAVLRRRFEQQQEALQNFVEMSKQDSEILKITPAQFETGSGKVYENGDGEIVLPSHRRGEYTQNLRKLHMSEASFSRSGNGEAYIGSQTFGVGGHGATMDMSIIRSLRRSPIVIFRVEKAMIPEDGVQSVTTD
jgi:hypothetical protein